MPHKKIFQTDAAPAAVGPYSQAVESQGFLFISGQIPINPKTNELIPSAAIEDQTLQVLTNVKSLLVARGLTLAHLVKTTIFLKNMSDFPTVNRIYATFFTESPPARACVEVSRLPKDVLIEIEGIATLV